MLLPPSVQDALAGLFSSHFTIEPLSGGMVSQAARLRGNTDSYFLKWNEAASAGLFSAEAAGLEALRSTGSLRIPEVIAFADSPEAKVPFLILEWLEPSAAADSEAFSLRFAESLANLHSMDAGAKFGWHQNNFLGMYPQINTPHESWPTFYCANRLAPQVEIARSAGLLPRYRQALLGKLMANLPELLAGMDFRPSLIHGDLWSGNYLSTSDGAALIDPAVYFAPREVELSFTELFGGFPPNFVFNYLQAWPLADGYEQRRGIHQLYYLLVHLNAFGEQYGSAVDSRCTEALKRL